MNALAAGMAGLSGSGAGLAPTDPCYDPNNAWYNTFWTSDAECACMAANPGQYGVWQRCASYTPAGVAQTTGTLVSDVVGGAATGLVSSAFAVPTAFVIAAAGLILLLVVKA